MNSTVIKIMIGMPPPDTTKAKKATEDLLEKIKDYCQACDEGSSDSRFEWDYLVSLYLKIKKRKKLGEMECRILEMVEPLIIKNGSDDPRIAAQIEGQDFNKHLGEQSWRS